MTVGTSNDEAEIRVAEVLEPHLIGLPGSVQADVVRRVIEAVAATTPSPTTLTPDQFATMLWNTIIIEDTFDQSLAPFKPHLDRAIKVMAEHNRYLIAPGRL